MIRIQTEDFEIGRETDALADDGQSGAIATFTGLVRASGDRQDVRALFLEHYPGMTESVIEDLIAQASERWSINAVRVIHRVGELALGERIVFVGVTSAHRGDAFAACEFLMDALKTSAPFWKKEITADGTSHWVEQKDSDRRKADDWQAG
ncbi:molybdopterin synthase catalytic subunit MoaE [Marinobacter bohaiensis]|uniref:molybdopterin synthase catalytic subunit MoaE n=1 Tax=Marinobacter bohaiensis TaxID=2201898 RepID=UPI000DAC72C2|nr:molybdopterin synthase catalytic subunit MoaE [Marinobacter bohaiensis]